MDFKQTVLQVIRARKMIKPGTMVIIGVSGGADSLALLHVLVELRHVLSVQLHAAHFNHHIRPDADADQYFVTNVCALLQVPLTVGKASFPRGNRIVSEEAARQARFDFFTGLATKLKATTLALAHTENDLAETVLMRLLRGTGLYGLRGILPQRHIQGVDFIRPFISINRSAVERYLKLRKQAFCVDSTNASTVYFRNKVRLKLMPLLAKEYNPQVANALVDLAQIASEDYEFLFKEAQQRLNTHGVVSRKAVRMPLKLIVKECPAMRHYLFRLMAEASTKLPVSLTFDQIKSIDDLFALGQSRAERHLSGSLRVIKTKQFLEFSYA